MKSIEQIEKKINKVESVVKGTTNPIDFIVYESERCRHESLINKLIVVIVLLILLLVGSNGAWIMHQICERL